MQLAAARTDRRRLRQTGTLTPEEDARLVRIIRRCRWLIPVAQRRYNAVVEREVNFGGCKYKPPG